MSGTGDQIRIVQESVAGKEITFAHVIGGPAPIIYQKLGLNPAIDYRSSAIGIMNMTPPESAVIAADIAVKSGDVYLGCGETRIMEFVVDIFAHLREDHPNMRLHLHSGDADAVMERLDKGLLDFGLLLGPLHHEKFDYLDLGMSDVYGLLMPRDCALAEQKSVPLDDLRDLPLIFPNQPYSGHQRLDWFGADFESLNIVATYNLLTNATFLVEAGLGYAFCIDGLVSTDGNRNLTFRPLDPLMTVGLSIAAKKYRVLSPAAKLFLDQLREAVRKHGRAG